MNLQRSAQEFNQWHSDWAEKEPITIEGKKYLIKTITCSDVCHIKLTEMITNHTTLLNYLIERYSLQSYLEIGINNPANNFDLVKCERKTGVDPESIENTMGVEFCNDINMVVKLIKTTSDEFFKRLIIDTSSKCGINEPVITQTFGAIFIDGLHHADQVKRDFENSLRCLRPGGFIVIHDCLPTDESTTHVPRDSKVWHGDVFKFCMILCTYPGIKFVTLDVDNGCCIVWKDDSAQPQSLDTVINWATYCSKGRDMMHVVSPADLEKYLPAHATAI